MEGKHFIKLNQVNVSLIVCFTNVLPYMIDKLKRLFFLKFEAKNKLKIFFFQSPKQKSERIMLPVKMFDESVSSVPSDVSPCSGKHVAKFLE